MKNPRIIFRVDGSSDIGMGHVVRSIRLAQAISERIPSQVIFATKTPEEVIERLKGFSFNHRIESFRNKSQESIICFYEAFKPHAVITDLSVTDNLEDYIKVVETVPLHVNLGENFFNYFNFGIVVFPSAFRVNPKCRCETGANYYIGAKYILIDPRLKDLPPPDYKNKPLKILVALGGADPRGWTKRVISIAKESGLNSNTVILNVVVGPANRNREVICKESQGEPIINVFEPQSELYDLIAQCDLAITSGGTTAYETISAGRPTWIIPEIEFEEEVAKILKSKKAIIDFGINNLKEGFFKRLEFIHDNPQSLEEIIKAGRKYIDGKGLIRIADKISSNLKAMKIPLGI